MVDVVGYVVGGEYIGYVGGGGVVFQVVFDFDVVVVYVQLVLKDVCVGFMVDGDEYVLQFYVFGVVVFGGFDLYVGDIGIVVQYFIQGVVLYYFDVVFGE